MVDQVAVLAYMVKDQVDQVGRLTRHNCQTHMVLQDQADQV
jgi:hypothetical protein